MPLDEVESLKSDWVTHELVVAKYPKDDLVGLFFGYYSLLVYEIQAVYITLFLWNRDLLTFYCCFTHLLSEIMNYFLKHLIKQPRPEHGAPNGGLFEGRYGMPSQHCHCFAYLITTILLLVFHYYRRYIRRSKRTLVLSISIIGLLLQVLGRIYLKFHTFEQCFVGVAFGSLSAITFYMIGLHFFLPNANYLCQFWILRTFSFKKDLITPPPFPELAQYHSSKLVDSNNPRQKID